MWDEIYTFLWVFLLVKMTNQNFYFCGISAVLDPFWWLLMYSPRNCTLEQVYINMLFDGYMGRS